MDTTLSFSGGPCPAVDYILRTLFYWGDSSQDDKVLHNLRRLLAGVHIYKCQDTRI